MKRKHYMVLTILFAIIILVCSSCSFAERDYYSDIDNYTCATGTVEYFTYNDDGSALYIEFSELSPAFDDNCFKIVGENLNIVKKNGIDDLLGLGLRLEFTTAQSCFGDGYVFPIVELSINGETLLEFEAGLSNLLKWLDAA